jgi:hypothetical protein
MRISLIASTLIMALCTSVNVVAADPSPTKAECSALDAWRDANPDAAVKQEERVCLRARLAAIRAAAVADKDATQAQINEMDRNAAKLPAN